MFDSTSSWRKVVKGKHICECFLGGGLSLNLAALDRPWVELFVLSGLGFPWRSLHSQPTPVVSINMPFNRVDKAELPGSKVSPLWFVNISHKLV